MTNQWQHYRTSYYVRAEADCTEHSEHALTGTGTEKSHIQPLITDVVADLPFYHDACDIDEVRGIYTGSQNHYKRPKGDRFEYKSDPIERIEKLYVTKKVKK